MTTKQAKAIEAFSNVRAHVMPDVPPEDLERLSLLAVSMLSDGRLAVVRGHVSGRPATVLCATWDTPQGQACAPLAVLSGDALDLTGPNGEPLLDGRTGEPAKPRRELPTGLYL